MIKLLGLLLSFFMGKFSFHGPKLNIREAAMAIFDEAIFKSRKAVTLLLTALASMIFICGGLFISLIDATRQYDQAGIINFSSTFISGLVLMLIAAGIVTWVFASAWPGVKKQGPQVQEVLERDTRPQPNTLETALSALIMDFVKERELKRESAPSAARPVPSQEREETPPTYAH